MADEAIVGETGGAEPTPFVSVVRDVLMASMGEVFARSKASEGSASLRPRDANAFEFVSEYDGVRTLVRVTVDVHPNAGG